jgi:hypothetical protein
LILVWILFLMIRVVKIRMRVHDVLRRLHYDYLFF